MFDQARGRGLSSRKARGAARDQSAVPRRQKPFQCAAPRLRIPHRSPAPCSFPPIPRPVHPRQGAAQPEEPTPAGRAVHHDRDGRPIREQARSGCHLRGRVRRLQAIFQHAELHDGSRNTRCDPPRKKSALPDLHHERPHPRRQMEPRADQLRTKPKPQLPPTRPE